MVVQIVAPDAGVGRESAGRHAVALQGLAERVAELAFVLIRDPDGDEIRGRIALHRQGLGAAPHLRLDGGEEGRAVQGGLGAGERREEEEGGARHRARSLSKSGGGRMGGRWRLSGTRCSSASESRMLGAIWSTGTQPEAEPQL